MEFTPHKFICQQTYMHKLNRGIIHRAVNRQIGLDNQLHDASHKIDNIICSEPTMFCQWVDESGRKVGFGRKALPRLRREISHSNKFIAICAIRQLSELVHDPEIAVEALKMNIIARFVKTLKSGNTDLQECSLECIKSLSTQPSGLLCVTNNQYIIEHIRKCILHTTSPIVRSQAAITVNSLAHNYIAVRALVDATFVKALMQNLIEAKDYTTENNPLNFQTMAHVKDMMVLNLDSLEKLLEDSDKPKIEAIAYDAFLLVPLISGECVRLKKAAASFFCQIAKHSIGKDGIFVHGLIQPLCHEFIHNEDVDIKSRMASVLQFATIHKEARKEAFNTDLFYYLISLVTKHNVPTNLILSGLKILTNFAEMPDGREILQNKIRQEVCTCLVKINGSKAMRDVLQKLINEIIGGP